MSPFLYLSEGYSNYIAANIWDAESAFYKGYQLAFEQKEIEWMVMCAASCVGMQLIGGRLNDSIRVCDDFSEKAKHLNIEQTNFGGWEQAIYSIPYREQGDIERSKDALLPLLQTLDKSKTDWQIVRTLVLHYDNLFANREYEQAFSVLEKLKSYCSGTQFLHYAGFRSYESILAHLNTYLDDKTSTDKWFQKTRQLLEQPACFQSLYDRSVLQWVAISNQEYDFSLTSLTEDRQVIKGKSYAVYLTVNYLLSAVCHLNLGDLENAKRVFLKAIESAEKGGYYQQLLCFNVELTKLLSLISDEEASDFITGIKSKSLMLNKRKTNKCKNHTLSQSEVALTKREFDVIKLIEEGLSNEAIANSLNISKGTVKIHCNNIFKKLNVKNRVAAVIEAKKTQTYMLH
ncbi:helix-turn-helix domain-containing protein [Pleionea sediminis]|uniref:helix-turn-helix domain-containing protein n=1 Tax=Pleionea sediminis TaxID=2569479 RepID=UPI0013DE0042|nr:response regulator transcription factor [Pleionea sediminis]